jgi:hypothetical protein
MATVTSFAADIRSLFTDRDIHAMSKAFNLASYDVSSGSVRQNRGLACPLYGNCHGVAVGGFVSFAPLRIDGGESPVIRSPDCS